MPRLLTTTLLVLAGWSAGSEGRASDWTRFHGSDGSGLSADTNLPVKWDRAEGLRWAADLPGRGLSCPVVARDKVFVTASSGPDLGRLHVLCFDAKTGHRFWERQFWGTGSTMSHQKTTMAAPTPVTDGDRVFAFFGTGDVVGLSAGGDLLWYRALARDYPTIGNNLGMASSLALAGDTLVVPLENPGESFLAGLDAATGRNRWRAERSRQLNWVTPAVVPGTERPQIVFQSSRDLTAVDAVSGAVLWRYSGANGFPTIPSPIIAGGLIITPGAKGVALKLKPSGSPEPAWESNKLGSQYATPAFADNRVYSINSAGVLSCLNAADGKLVWQERLKGPFTASPVVADGKVYAVNDKGETFVVRVGDKPKTLAVNPLGDVILATPAIAGGSLFFRSDAKLYCVGAK